MKQLLCAVLAALAASGATVAQERVSASQPRDPAAEARFGVSLVGAEFAGHKLPGVVNRDCTCPTPAELDYCLARGRALVMQVILDPSGVNPCTIC